MLYTRKEHAQRLLRDLRKSCKPARVAADEKFWRGGEPFCLRYFEECDAILHEDPAVGLEWARLAPYLAGVVECEPESRRKELLAHGYAIHGGAWRLLGDFERSESLYEQALKLARRKGFSDAAKGNVWRRLAGLRMAQKRFDEALELADRAIAVYRLADSFQARQDLAWALTTRGTVLSHGSKYEEALPWHAEALRYADPHASPRTYHAAVHNIAVAVALGVCTTGTVAQTFRDVRAARRGLKNQNRSLPRAKLVWLEGRLLARVHPEQAEASYVDARADLTRFGAAYEVCLISLDLGELYLAQERWRELGELAEETLELAGRLSVRDEALGALRLWSEAVRGEVAAAVEQATRAARLTFGQA